MRTLTNLYLVLFIAVGLLSVGDAALLLTGGASPLSEARGLAIDALAFMSLALFGLAALTPRVPKRVAIPGAIFVVWLVCYGSPLPLYTGLDLAGLIVGCAQLVVGALLFAGVRRLTGGSSWFVTSASLAERPAVSILHTIVFVAATLILGPVLFAAYLFVSAAMAVEKLTAGFVEIRPAGIQAERREYRRGDKSVELIAMVHIGDKGHYDTLFASIPREGSIVLMEGVSDDQGVLTDNFTYRKLAARLGLESQEELPGFREDPDPGGMLLIDGDLPAMRADVDASELNPDTIELINKVGEVLGGDDLPRALKAYFDYVSAAKPELLEVVFDDLLHRRSQRVIAALEPALAAHDRVVVPWGAAHLPEIEAAVLGSGFALADSHERLIITFH